MNKIFRREDISKELLEDAMKFYPSSLNQSLFQSSNNYPKKVPQWTDQEMKDKLEYVKNLMAEEKKKNNID